MGYGDDPQLMPSDDEVAEAEEQTRRLLARYGEPATVEPPPGLNSRVVAALPAARRPLRPLRLRVEVWAAAAAALLLALGTWGIMSITPPSQAATPTSMLGQISLALAARPLLGTMVLAGLTVALVTLAVAGAIWLWRRGGKS